jgi:arabinogalactan endo-1,4-beta-galactosidase
MSVSPFPARRQILQSVAGLALVSACGQPSSPRITAQGGSGGVASGGVASSSGGAGAESRAGDSTGGSLAGSDAAGGGKASGAAGVAGAGLAGTSSGGASPGANVGNPKFILGADVSSLLEREAAGAKFVDHGLQLDLFALLKARGFNYIRLRTWVAPGASDGYAAGKPDAWCDQAHTVVAAKRITAAGLGLLIDFHYSDTWTDPGTQAKPQAWANLGPAELRTQVHDYTKGVITALAAAGATPHMVQIGNEITGGMLWEDGKSFPQANFPNFAALLKAGVSGVKEVDPNILIMLHIDRCHSLADSKWWFGSVIDNGVPFDVAGQSCYQGTQGTPADWQSTFNALAADAKFSNLKFIAAEYSEEKRALNDILFKLPDARGRGSFIFEPTYWLEKFFDQTGNTYTTNALLDLYPQMAEAYGLK